MQLVRPRFESTLAIAERLASKPEPLRCIWLRHLLQSRSHSTAWQSRTWLSLPIGVCQSHECGNQQPIRVISSSVYAMHAVYAIDAVQQAAGAPVSP